MINVAGHRLGTREIEESISSHPNVAEVAVVGVADALKGQVAMAFVGAEGCVAGRTTPDAALKLEGEIMKMVDEQLGAVARPARVRFVAVLPKTRSGKLLRRAIQAVCEQRDPGDLTTIEDPTALQQIKDLVAALIGAGVEPRRSALRRMAASAHRAWPAQWPLVAGERMRGVSVVVVRAGAGRRVAGAAAAPTLPGPAFPSFDVGR